MKNIYILTLSIFIFSSCSKDGIAGDKYGSAIAMKNQTSIQEVLSAPDENMGKEFLISGNITKVCQKKGCWMTIMEDSTEIYIRFKDYGFFMPKDGFGRKAYAQGIYSNTL